MLRWVCLLCCALLSAPVSAQSNYPERPIRLVVAFVPGGATDTLARQISKDLQEALGQPIVVENRPGANGYLAWNYVAASEPDGYTLLLAENALGMSQALYKKNASNFDPIRQYDAIAGIATSPLALVVANNVKANSVAELIALSRTVPQKMNYASAGVGSVAHLVFEVFRVGAGMELVHIPYKGGGQAINDVIGGQVDMVMSAIPVAKGVIEGGRVKGLAVTSLTRSPALPNVPALRETGVKTVDVDLRFWFALFGPKGTPEAAKTKLDAAVAKVMADPKLRERLAQIDIEPAYLPAGPLQQKLVNEITNWTKFVDEHGIKAE
jgi:tripartite-type tricarboxylate transporter receptor subunit TctC